MSNFNACFIVSMINKNNYTLRFANMAIKAIHTLNKYYSINNLYILIIFQDESVLKDTELLAIKDSIRNVCDNTKNLYIKDVDVNIAFDLKFPIMNQNAGRIDKSAMFKFYIPQFVGCDSIWYFDCDVLFCGNVLDNLNDGIKEDTLFKFYKPHLTTINSGIFYVNNNKYKELDVLSYVKVFYDKGSGRHYIDQGCFNDIISRVFNNNTVISEAANIHIRPKCDIKNLEPGIYHVMGSDKSSFNVVYNMIVQ